MRMKWTSAALAATLALAAASLGAQPPAPDPLGEHLFPVELVMQNQQALGLSEDQRTFIRSEIQKAQGRFADLQWQLQAEVETMGALLKQDRAEEQKVLAQLDRIVALEREIKRTHLALLVRVKNKLTPEQQVRLQEIRKRRQGQ